MKRMSILSDAERQFAERYHDEVVIRFLRRNQLLESEYYDIVIFGYLVAVQTYLTDERIQKYSFKTIAWRNMRYALIEEYIKLNRQKRKAGKVDLSDDLALNEWQQTNTVPSIDALVSDRMEKQELLVKALSHLTQKEKDVVLLKAKGYTYREISEQYQLTVQGVYSRVSRFRKRLKSDNITLHRNAA